MVSIIHPPKKNEISTALSVRLSPKLAGLGLLMLLMLAVNPLPTMADGGTIYLPVVFRSEPSIEMLYSHTFADDVWSTNDSGGCDYRHDDNDENYRIRADGSQLTQLLEQEFENIQYVGWVAQ